MNNDAEYSFNNPAQNRPLASRPRVVAKVDRLTLEEQTKQFLARGGVISKIPIGVCKEEPITLTEAQKLIANAPMRG